jgi:dienelactone hydrolase
MSRSAGCSVVIAFALCSSVVAVCGDTFAASPKLVEFEGAAQPPDQLQERLALERGKIPKTIRGDRLRGFLAKPEGDGPFPALVALHGCIGLPEAVVQGVSERAVSSGYVMLLADSFTTRSIDHTCTPDRYAAVNIAKRTLDAYGALLFLARQPFVDAHRVAVVGASQGGMVTLSLAQEHARNPFVNPDNLAFRAAIALYPGCGVVSARPSIPTLILVGELDDWTPVNDCVRAIAYWGTAGAPIELVTYPAAHHAFDVQIFQPGRMMFGHLVEYHAEAAENAQRKMRVFLAEYLASG